MIPVHAVAKNLFDAGFRDVPDVVDALDVCLDNRNVDIVQLLRRTINGE